MLEVLWALLSNELPPRCGQWCWSVCTIDVQGCHRLLLSVLCSLRMWRVLHDAGATHCGRSAQAVHAAEVDRCSPATCWGSL